MKLLVGLGNPGRDYARHRHNIGFLAVDRIADAFDFGSERTKFQGLIREGRIDGANGRGKALILKPQTFMNDSGRSVAEAIRFYKIALGDVIVFHDELDLAPGKCRIKTGGGAAGHNGLRSLDRHIGNEFIRVRLGIGHPGRKEAVHGHVLGNFSKADETWLEPLLEALSRSADHLMGDDAKTLERFQSQVANLTMPDKDRKTQKARTKPGVESTEKAPVSKHTPATEEKEKPANAFHDALKSLFSGRS